MSVPDRMEAFMAKTLTALRAQAGFFDSELKEAIDKTMKALVEDQKSRKPTAEETDADRYFRPLAMSCEKNSSKLRLIALDAIEKLITYGYLRGVARVRQAETDRFLIDIVVETICACRDDTNDAVQLNVIKALLTTITCPTCSVREQSLLLAVRAVFHIYLVSRNATNKSTAKTTLRQMLEFVFKRMETHAQKMAAGVSKGDEAESGTAQVPPAASDTSSEKAPAPGAGAIPHAETAAAAVESVPVESPPVNDSVASAAEAVPAADVFGPFKVNMYDSVISLLGYNFASEEPAAAPTVAEAPQPVAEAPAAPVVSATQTPTKSTAAAPKERAAAHPGAFQPGSTSLDAIDLQGFPSHYHRDAFILFRALCRLSMRGDEDPLLPAGAVHLPGAGPAPAGGPAPTDTNAVISDEALLNDPIALQSKLLALDLVLALLESSGPAFQSNARFIGAIKQYLCVGLLKNILSVIPAVASQSLKVFLSLMRRFKKHIPAEIEIFISTIFLRLLTSEHSTFEQKMAVLQAFTSIAKDDQGVLEMFVNFDCTPGRQNLLEDSVSVLASIAQGRTSAEFNASQKTVAEAIAIRHAAMQTLAQILQSVTVLADKTLPQFSHQITASAVSTKTEGDAKEDESADVESASTAAASEGHTRALSSPPTSASAALAKGYEEQQKRRAMVETAALKFQVKQKDGVAYMRRMGMVDDTPESLAKLFHELCESLDKTAIGDYMGEEKEFNVAVLHAYTDQMDFTGLSFDAAIRYFLAGFRLPGESQKIDRIMEKFAQRYCVHNPNVFPSTDTAFILAYSIIMLNTDAHNPNIKPEKKMTKNGFISNNRGIANGANLPSEFLGSIYDAIVQNPITLKEDDKLRAKKEATSHDERQRRALQAAERAELVKVGHAAMTSARKSAKFAAASAQLIANAGDDSTHNGTADSTGSGQNAAASASNYFTHDDVLVSDHVGPIFSLIWAPVLAVFSVLLETSGDDDPQTINVCLVGFAQAIHVAGVLKMDTPRDMLVTSLCKFTHLEPGAGVREMKHKHLACVRALFNIAMNEGDRLGCAWGPVLVCISQCARLLLVAQNGKDDAVFFAAADAHRGSAAANKQHTHPDKLRAEMEKQQREHAIQRHNAAMIASAITEPDITRVFTRSTLLSGEAIVDFVTQLAAVSLQELAAVVVPPAAFPTIGQPLVQQQPGTAAAHHKTAAGAGPQHASSSTTMQPRIFSLQKVVEVADFNMDARPRMTWNRIWDALSMYFAAVCCSNNVQIAMYAIDSLKQLSTKFLEKQELKSFHFQTKFLQPFLDLMKSTNKQKGPTHPHRNNSEGALAKHGIVRGRDSSLMSPTQEIRELILHVCANLIRARHNNIRSGWKTFMAVYAAAADDTDELIVSLAFGTIHEVLTTHIEQVAAAGAFVDAVHCMIAFGTNYHPLFALRAIDHCASLGAQLARGKVPLTEDAIDEYQQYSSGTTIRVGAATTTSAEASTPQVDAAVSHGRGRSPSVAGEEWYDLDGSEHADVVESEQALKMRHAKVGNIGGEAAVVGDDHNDARDRSGSSVNVTTEDASDDVFEHENATDAAMLMADQQAGGKIRRFTDSRVHMQLWWPLLTGLARLVSSDERLPVRMRALHALFALLRRYGPGFSPNLWSLVYSGVLLPIFDDVRHVPDETSGAPPQDLEAPDVASHYSMREFTSGRSMPHPSVSVGASDGWNTLQPGSFVTPGRANATSDSAHEWLRTTCMPALSSLVRLQTRFFRRLHHLLPALLGLIESCIDQEIEGLARIGVACFRQLLAEAGPRFDGDTWELVTKSLTRLFELCTPRPLMEARQVLLPPHDRFSDVEEGEAPHEDELQHLLAGHGLTTPFGEGQIEGCREADKIVIVRLGWGKAYIYVKHFDEFVEGARQAVAASLEGQQDTETSTPPPEVETPPLPFNSVRVVTQCVVQLELITAVGVLADAHLASLRDDHVHSLLQLLQDSADFARRFNGDRALRKALWSSGFMKFAKHNKLPSLLRQETAATQQLLVLLLRLYGFGAEAAPAWRPLALAHLRTLSEQMVDRYIDLAFEADRARLLATPAYMHPAFSSASSAPLSRRHGARAGTAHTEDSLLDGGGSIDKDIFREAAAYGPLVTCLLEGLLQFDDEQFRSNLEWLYPLLTGLIVAGNLDIRAQVATVFDTRLRTLLPISAPKPATQQTAAASNPYPALDMPVD